MRAVDLFDGLLLFFDFVDHFSKSGKSEFEWPTGFGISMSWWDNMVVPDTAGTGGNVAAGVAHGHMRAFQRYAASSRDHLLKSGSARVEANASEHLLRAINVESR